MSTTSARLPRLLALGALVMLVAAACSSSAGGAGWTYAPPVTTPAASAGGSPGASGSAAATGSPTPTASAPTAATMTASMSMSAVPSTPAASGGGNVIQLNETADLHITDPSGSVVSSITVQKGQTYTFQITNTAGYDHDFYIGAPDDLKAANTANLKGLAQFASGTQSFQYTFDTDGPLGFGCTLPGHYQSMNGLFVIQ